MRIWRGYGSEHSANLIMIGRFATPEDALTAITELEQLIQQVQGEFDYDRFDDNPMSLYEDGSLREFLSELGLYIFSAEDPETFNRDHNLQRRSEEIEIRTDEWDVSGFLKFMIHKSARVEIYSAHDFPNVSR